MEKSYTIGLNGKPGSVAHLDWLCGCAPKLMLVLTTGTKRHACVRCSMAMDVTIELTYPPGGGRLTVRQVVSNDPSQPPQGAGTPAPLQPQPSLKTGHAPLPEADQPPPSV